jgi:tyrosine-specific transport protein
MKIGKVGGGILLIAGSCLGVGMLALPISTGLAGFFPTLLLTFLAFGFMTTTALYLVEVGSWFSHHSNLSTQIGQTLGKFWKSLSWMIYLFLFYSLLVAYISASGVHLASIADSLFSTKIPNWAGSVGFVLLFGWIVYLGTHVVDHVNRYLMAGKILAFILLILLGFSQVKLSNLTHEKAQYAFFSLPVLVISFGFHNMIPALNQYLDGDKNKVKKAIKGGAFFTFVVYLIWQFVAIGILPYSGSEGILASYQMGVDATQAIKNFVSSPWVGFAGQSLAFFAILTSFLAQTLSLTHFLSDGLKKTRSNHVLVCLLVLLPPLACAMSNPNIFYDAMNFAGGICAVILFGLIPALMLLKGKEQTKKHSFIKKVCIFSVIAFACFILLNQVAILLGLDIIPQP